MWITIRNPEGPNFSLPAPLFLMKSRLMLLMAQKSGSDEFAKVYPYLKDIYAAIRDYVRKNGHFTLVDIESADGSKVRITV